MPAGYFTIPTRIYLTDEQREKLMMMVRKHEVDVPELLTELLISFLDHLPEYEDQPDSGSEPESGSLEAELRQRRSELRRLRLRVAQSSDTAPPWLKGYMSDLENEIQRLERDDTSDE
jgi:hypothetical protein